MDTQDKGIPLPLAAQMMRRDPQWIRARVIRGELTGRQIEGRWFLDADQVQALAPK
jgi:hypothetical protein